MKRWRFVTSRVNALIAMIYLFVSVPAYLGYLDNTPGDIFLSLPTEGSGSTLTNFARLCFLFICILTYPLEMLVVRDIVKSSWYRPDDHKGIHHDGTSIMDLFLTGREFFIVIFLDICALVLGLVLHDLGDACAFVGALGGSIVCFILPGMVYLGVNGDDFIPLTNSAIGDDREYVSFNAENNLAKNEPLLSEASKPWWYYVFGFPLWCYIAEVGKTGVEKKLSKSPGRQFIGSFDSYDEDRSFSGAQLVSAPSLDGSVISDSFFSFLDYTDGMCGTPRSRSASKMKFFVAISLIMFGFVNLVVGLLERFEFVNNTRR